jgi:outer membrane beta-barrel protein
MRKFYIALILISIVSLGHRDARANELGVENDPDVDTVEAEIEKSAPKQKPVTEKKIEDEKIEKFEDLVKLSSFSEVSVIQKRFLPKTKRFQAFAGLNYLTNDPWYWGMGVSGKFGYFFTEAWGIEASGSVFSTSEKQAIKDLRDSHAVSTSSLVTSKSFLGLDCVWTPVYGKLGLNNRKIIPFDMYFAAGFGNSGTSDSKSAATLHLGTGQIFALSKSMGVRWDFSWNRYSATVKDDTTGNSSSSTFDNLLLTLGVSFFFPEAKYR